MIKKVLAAVLLTVGLLVPVGLASTPSASSLTHVTASFSWCNGTAYLKTNRWSINNHADGATDHPAFKLEGFGGYWHCPNGSASDRVMVDYTVLCATKTDSTYSNHVSGVKWNAYYGNDYGKVVNPPEMFLDLPNSGIEKGRQYCQRQDIPAADQEVWWLYSNPKWSLSGWYTIDLYPDDEWHFKEDGYSWHWLTPSIDPYVDYPF